MARDRVVERGREMRSLAIVAREMRVRLGDVGARTLQRREAVLRRHGEDLERGPGGGSAPNGPIEDLGLAAFPRNLESGLGAVVLPQQVRTPRAPAAVGNPERGPTLRPSR